MGDGTKREKTVVELATELRGRLEMLDGRKESGRERLAGLYQKDTELKLETLAESDRAAESRDPWAHRSTGMQCRTCMWYLQKGYEGTPPSKILLEIGRCRRRGPTMDGYPVVYPDDWCGDHRLDEGKV